MNCEASQISSSTGPGETALVSSFRLPFLPLFLEGRPGPERILWSGRADADLGPDLDPDPDSGLVPALGAEPLGGLFFRMAFPFVSDSFYLYLFLHLFKSNFCLIFLISCKGFPCVQL